ncbi:MAG: EF-P beta-lysylation protein EpmB [Idiomarina sp.]|nr:EF-P beta-lysylation protein EpmB [Idiomarina sp.]
MGDLNSEWQAELARAYNSAESLAAALQLPQSWVTSHHSARKLFPIRVPRPFAELIEAGNPDDPLLLQVAPHAHEHAQRDGFSTDPLGEADATATSGVLHKYGSRVLVILRGGCAVNCRYCFRRHFPYDEHKFGQAECEQALNYIQLHPEINEVILSGGDPLMAKDRQLETILTAFAALPQIRRIRIHTRLPVVIPQRLTTELKTLLMGVGVPVIMVLHINHARELGQRLADTLSQWNNVGITWLNQSVLLKGVNDSAETLCELSERLFEVGILPYYLHQLDRVQGAAHFAVEDAQAILIMQEVTARLPGFLVPKFVREIHGEASKTPINLQR